MADPLRQLAPDLWVAEQDQRFLGAEIGTRMTVVRLPGPREEAGGLLLISPVRTTPALREALDALGPVRFAVAPNRFHHLHVAAVRDHWPDAALWAAPGLETKRADVAWTGVLGDAAPPGWAGRLEQHVFRGFPLANEVVFLHPPSRTLILTDLAFNIRRSSGRTGLALRLLRIQGRFGPTFLERLAMRGPGARESLETILAWDFDRVVVAHGDVVDRDGKASLRRGYAWLLGAA